MNVSALTYSMSACTRLCSKTMPPSAKGGFLGNIGNHIATPLETMMTSQKGSSHTRPPVHVHVRDLNLLLDSGSGDVEAGGPLCSRVNIWSGETS